jgi:hypothetical protein
VRTTTDRYVYTQTHLKTQLRTFTHRMAPVVQQLPRLAGPTLGYANRRFTARRVGGTVGSAGSAGDSPLAPGIRDIPESPGIHRVCTGDSQGCTGNSPAIHPPIQRGTPGIQQGFTVAIRRGFTVGVHQGSMRAIHRGVVSPGKTFHQACAHRRFTAPRTRDNS